MNNRTIIITKKDILIVVLLVLFLLLCLIKEVDSMFAVSLTSYFIVLAIALRNYKKNIVFCAFLVTLFVFLYGSPVATLLLGSTYDVHFSDEAKHHLYFSLFLSSVFVGVGYLFLPKVTITHTNKETSDTLKMSLRQTSKVIFYISYALKALQYLEIGYYVLSYGYMYYYTEYTSAMPLIIEKISDLYIVALSIFLATNPSKRECKPVMTIFVLGGLLSLITGKRYEFVYVLLLYLIYVVLRSWQTSDNPLRADRSARRRLYLMILVVPLLIVFLMYIGAARSKIDFHFESLVDVILSFMVDIGNSGKVIMRGFQFQDVIPSGRLYSFGSIIEYFKYNFFSVKLLGISAPNPRTLEYVQTGHSFAYMITYYYSADSFFSGHGQGSSYIAELYADFGYIGIVLGSIVLGFFIRRTFSFSGKSVIHDAFLYFLIRPLLFIPRDTYCLPISYLLNVKYLAAFLVIYLIAQYRIKKYAIPDRGASV